MNTCRSGSTDPLHPTAEEIAVSWNPWIRQFHRWVSIAFTLSVIATFIALAQKNPIVWISYIPLLPLFVLVVTGLYLFMIPYVAKWRSGQGVVG
ncbi:MAG: hypothetical protein ABI411_18980 [Tahibacter sp.]